MDDNFRTSKAHLQDITKVIDYLAARGYKLIYLVGASRGTISAAHIGKAAAADVRLTTADIDQ
jgi:methylmalonyl-CoA mutase cobalamin-binding subunit